VPAGDIGGSFGVKGEVYPEDLLIPLLAVRLDCSLAWIESRAEHAVGTNQSRAQHWEVDVVTDGDGILLAAQIEIIADAGAYPRPLTTLVPYLASAMFPGPYRLPWYRARVRPVLSTRPPIGTVRAPGRYEANAVREHVLERVAARLGLSPDEVRRRNLLTQGDMPYDTGTLNEGPVHYDTGDFRAAFESALLSQPPVESDSADGLRRAVATIPFVEKAGLGGAERATAWANADGTVGVGVASAPSGQSHATTFAVAAARTLGIDPERVSVQFDYSGVEGSPASIGTFASRGAMHTGNAVEAACRALDAQLRERTGRSLAALTPDVLARLSPRAEAIGRFDTAGHTYPYGAVTCAVAVDPELYTVRVEYLSVHCDVGVPLDDGVVRGQLIGGAVQGISATLGEAFHYTADGKPMNTSLETYPLVRATDVPPVRITLLEPAPPTHRSAHNPLGVKGIGEAGMAASGSALTAAVTRALPAAREGLSSLPLTPSTLWAAGLSGGAEQDAPTKTSGEK
jgi:carbon-monoxide dehydrogenase large subunit